MRPAGGGSHQQSVSGVAPPGQTSVSGQALTCPSPAGGQSASALPPGSSAGWQVQVGTAPWSNGAALCSIPWNMELIQGPPPVPNQGGPSAGWATQWEAMQQMAQAQMQQQQRQSQVKQA